MGRRGLAIVGGASAGIGAALAEALARRGLDLLLVARRKEALAQVAERCRAASAERVAVLAADLSAPDATARIEAELGGLESEPEVLVNNAGFGVHGPFAETPLERELEMIDLQLKLMVELTKALLPGMIERGAGRILNVASVYSFTPVVGQAIYAACKAFMLSFSESLAAELRGTGVTVTACCPGITATEFRERAGMPEKKSFLSMDAERVAAAACGALFAGRRVSVPGLLNRTFVFGTRLVPRGLSTAVTRRINAWRGIREGDRT